MVEPEWLDHTEEIRLGHTQVGDFLDTGPPVGSCQSQSNKDAELPDETTEDTVDVYSSRHGHSAASKTKDGENSLDQGTS